MDEVVVLKEVLDYVKVSKQECLIFKVDFEKAHDSISWSFFDYMMWRFGFDVRWMACIHDWVFSRIISILKNGLSIEKISIQKSLKQVDPLAAFLFLLVVEGLSASLKKVVPARLFEGFNVVSKGLWCHT